jgi:hypothetical protein
VNEIKSYESQPHGLILIDRTTRDNSYPYTPKTETLTIPYGTCIIFFSPVNPNKPTECSMENLKQMIEGYERLGFKIESFGLWDQQTYEFYLFERDEDSHFIYVSIYKPSTDTIQIGTTTYVVSGGRQFSDLLLAPILPLMKN